MLNETFSVIFKHRAWKFFFFFKTKKAFRLITSSVRQFDINIHFESILVASYEYGENEERRQGFLFARIIYHHFCIWRKFGKICITIWCARHALKVEQRFFEKRVADDKWRSHTLSKRNENWNAKQKCILKRQVHGVWKSQKKSHSTLRAKRATFTFWVDKS